MKMAEAATQPTSASASLPLPRVAIQFCTQCKWMLRAAYFAQELLSTFSTSIGEVALQPSTGGIFTVTLTYLAPGASATSTTILWDRKTEGGFPETKELKRRLRDVIQPDRDLGHVDRNHAKPTTTEPAPSNSQPTTPAAAMTSSVSDITSQLKKHPANKNRQEPATGAPQEEDSTPLGDEALAAVASARANKGQQEKAEVSFTDQIPGKLQPKRPTDDGQSKETCEDCT
ncbi:hypothetical protein CCHL11_03461 [Colletotrichum chlorophyti]|uniref:Uncharacterized protein n=1 Tax=Colletotrichum chlorophyti TaxID=708187 RepID=A0A1Q8S047_9PEZI|nr:hypothetical protein CCHL11_03461 [Colletotrichum chlorophyti]